VRSSGLVRGAPDLVERNFTAVAPDRLWMADITYMPTWVGFLDLAVVTALTGAVSSAVDGDEAGCRC